MKRILSLAIIGILCVSMFSIFTPRVMGWASSLPSPLHGRMAYDALEGTGWSDSDRTEISYNYACKEIYTDYHHRVDFYQDKLHAYHGGLDELVGICKCKKEGTYGGAEDGAYHYIQLARSYYTNDNVPEALKCLGYAIHFIQDSVCPPHVFPFQDLGSGIGAAPDFEIYTAYVSIDPIIDNYADKKWHSRVISAAKVPIGSALDLQQKVQAAADEVWTRFSSLSSGFGYTRQDGKWIGDVSGETLYWMMSDDDIGWCMEKAASLVKSAAIYVLQGPSFDFLISATSSKFFYRGGETSEVIVDVENRRQEASTLWLSASFKDPSGESHKYDVWISVSPLSANLGPGESTAFSVKWTLPEDAPDGPYQIAVNCWKDFPPAEKYTDNLDWEEIFYVYKLSILTPTFSKPAMAGDPSNPNEILVSVEWIPRWLKPFTTPTFFIEIGNQPATCELIDPWNQLFGTYTLKITPPIMPSEDLYNLNIAATFGELADSDMELEAIKYTTAPSQEPIQKGLAWLRTRQNSDGSWDGNVGVTALCALTFLNAGLDVSDLTIQKAIQYLLSNAHSDGSIYNSYATYETSLALVALAATHNSAYQARINSARDWLVNSQWDESCIWGSTNKDNWFYGGFGYGWNVRPDLSNTQFALLALDAAGLPKDNPLWTKVQVFLHRTQNINFPITLNIGGSEYTVQPYNFYGGYDGGFMYYPGTSLAGGQTSYGSMTGAGIWGLLLSGVPKTDARVIAAMNWVKNHYTWDTNPGYEWNWPYYYYLSMSKARTMYGQPTIDGHDWYQELYGKIIGMQINASSGQGYWSTPVENFDPDLTTAYAILSLQTRAVAQPVQRLSYLTFSLRSNCLIRVIDPEGNLVGYNNMTGLGENQVPTAVYSGPFSEPQYIVIINPKAGTYKLELIGVSEGPYTLTIQGNYGEDVTDTFEYTGYIKPAQIHGSDVIVTAIVGPLDIYTEQPEGIESLPPVTTLEIGEPKYISKTFYVTPATTFTLSATDDASGVNRTEFRIYNSTIDTLWVDYAGPFNLSQYNNGEYTLLYRSIDNAGNVEDNPDNYVNITLVRAHDCPGDVTGDGHCDIFDIAALAFFFGTQAGESKWNPIMDFKPDSTIDVFDIVKCLQYYNS